MGSYDRSIPDGGFKMSAVRYRCSPNCGGTSGAHRPQECTSAIRVERAENVVPYRDVPHPDAWNGANARAQVARDDRRFHHDSYGPTEENHADKFIRDVTHWASEQGCPSRVVIADWLKTQKIATPAFIAEVERLSAAEGTRADALQDRLDSAVEILRRAAPVLADCFPTHPDVKVLLAGIEGFVNPCGVITEVDLAANRITLSDAPKVHFFERDAHPGPRFNREIDWSKL